MRSEDARLEDGEGHQFDGERGFVGGNGQKNTMHYTVETDDMVYFIDYTYQPGEHKNGKPPDIGGNTVTKIAVEGKHAYVLDATGQEIKLKVVKKTKK